MKVTKARIVKVLVSAGVEQSQSFKGRICNTATRGFSVRKCWDDRFEVDYFVNSYNNSAEKYQEAMNTIREALVGAGFEITELRDGGFKI
jgi:hypothetical protein